MRGRDQNIPELEKAEIDLLLEGVRRLHGIDLQEHSAVPLRRRIWEAIRREQVRTISGLQEKLLHEPEALERFVRSLLPQAEPQSAAFLEKFRADIVPLLRTYPFIRIWQVGSASAFDCYAMAIILLEEGIYERSTLYHTDVDELAVARARDGLFPMAELRDYERLYLDSGGTTRLDGYCSRGEESGMFDAMLRRNMVFARHDFATDGSLNEFNAIFCRNSLGSLERRTRGRAEETFCESVVLFGILGLTHGERLETPATVERFARLDQEHNLYRRIP